MDKKNKNRLIFVSLIVIAFIVVVTIISVFTKKKEEFYLTIVPKSYCFVTDNKVDKELEAMVYVTNKESFITDKDQITNAYIESRNRLDKLKIYLKSISDCNITKVINKKIYYLFSFVFTLPQVDATNYDLCINDAILLLECINDEIEIKLGSFYYYKIPYFGDESENLSISKLKGIVNYVNANKTLVGLVLGLRNNSKDDITITSIDIFDKTIHPSMSDIKLIDDDVSSSDNLSGLLGYEYNIYKEEDKEAKDIVIYKDETVNYLIPLKYINDYIIDSASMVINYQVNNKDYSYYLDNITLFTDFNLTIDESKLEVLTYNGN